MRCALRFLLLMAMAAPMIGQSEDAPYFSLSSNRTFGSHAQPSVNVSSWNVDALEFRVYRINDSVKFFEQLQDPHEFGGGVRRPSEKLTLLELLHRWKHELRANIRRSLRAQFTEAPSAHFEWLFPKKAAPTGQRGTHFAEAPVLNPQQLVLTFTEPVHASSRWDSETVNIGVKEKGLYLVEAVKGELRAYTILMVSDIVMITKTQPGGVLAYVARRGNGQPVAGAEVTFIRPGGDSVAETTNADGIAEAKIEAASTPADDRGLRIVARHGADMAAVAPWTWGNREEWSGYIYTDRPVYRPGHTVHFKGILRVRAAVGYDVPAGKQVQVRIQDPEAKPVYQKTLTTSANGTVEDQFDLEAGAALGDYYIEIGGDERQMMGNFSVQEYKKPEYEVRVTPAKGHVLEGDGVDAVIDARYYFGEPVAGAKVKYTIYRSHYWAPFFYEPDDDAIENGGDEGGDYEADSEQIEQTEGQLDADGKLAIHFDTTVSDKRHDFRYRIEAAVTDEGKREIPGTGWVIASYGSFLVNAEPDRYIYRPGDRANFKIEARDYSNQPVQTPVHVELVRWDRAERGTTVASVDVSTGADGSAPAQIAIPQNVSWLHVRVTAKTPEGREVEDESYLWIDSGVWADWEGPGQQNIQILPDKKSYRPGDTAKVLIVTGKPGTPVLVTVESGRLHSARVIRSKEATVLFEVPIKVEDEPGFFVSAAFVRDGEMHQGSKRIKAPPDEHKLDLKVSTDRPQYQPGQTATYRIQAVDSQGRPVARADLSLGVVDEAIYAIQRDALQDILAFFYGSVTNRVNTENSLGYYFSGSAGKRRMRLAQFRAMSRLAQLKPERLVLPKVRKLFPDTAFWAADLITDASGVALAKVPFPDSLTTWRATVRGIAGDKVGNTTQKTIVRKNLILRLAVPRFFVQGDEVVISAIVHNYLETAKTARVSLDLAGLDVLDGKTRDIEVPVRGEVRVDWRVRAAAVRSATIKGQALTDEESDALELELPVNPPGVQMARSKGGSLAGAGAADFNLAFPADVQPGSRSLALRVSPSIAGSLFGALDYLISFPYGCVEQTMSSFLPNIIVKRSVQELGLKPQIDEAALEEKIHAGLERLYGFQHEDGGWGWWETDDSHPFMTGYVIVGLVEARAAGTAINDQAIAKGAAWLRGYLTQNPRLAPDLQAYSAYALTLAENDQAAAWRQTAYEQRAQLSPYGLALLGLAFERAKDGRAGELAQTLEGGAKQDDQQAWWPAARDEMLDFDADVTPEATAYAVKFLSHQRPSSPLLPKAAQWLMNHRNEGYWWESTKQTAMVIYGLTDYLKASGELHPRLTATVAVNGRTVLTRTFDDATAVDAPELKLDESKLAAGDNAIRVTATGSGKLYYSARAEYFSTSQKLEKTGTVSLNLLRDYFRLVPQKVGDRTVYDIAPLTGPVASGDTIAVRLTVTGTEWKYLLIEDPIPAGCEFIARDNLYEFAHRPPWWEYWFTRREMHDDRMAIFQTWFYRGQREYFYLLKVVNPGSFNVSPARVQPMYQPGFLSTTESRRLEVK